jgi:sterol carrier protein 2
MAVGFEKMFTGSL